MAHALTGHHQHARARSRAAAVSIVSNTLLIALKLVAGVLTGSVAILTEALHSGDRPAGLPDRVLLRPPRRGAGRREPPLRPREVRERRRGRRGHADPRRLGGDRVRRRPRPDHGPELEHLGIGIVVIGFASVANLAVSSWLFRRARETSIARAGRRRRAPAHRRLHVDRRARRPRARQRHRRRLARPRRGADHRRRDRGHRRRGSRWARCACSSTRRSPRTSSRRSGTRSRRSPDRGVVGYHQLRTRRAGARRYVDLHVQFRHGTTLEEAHRTAHELQDAIRAALNGADVLIHLEPEDRVRPGETLRTG